jgi:hypothetical protein
MVKASFLTFFYPLSEGLIWDRRLWYAVVAFVSLSYIAIIIDFPLTCGTDARNNFRLSQYLQGQHSILDVTDFYNRCVYLNARHPPPTAQSEDEHGS